MKNLFGSMGIAGGFLAASLMGPAVMANSMIVLYQGPYSYGDGGEFTAMTSGSPSLVNLGEYSPYTGTANSFQTFCVQTAVDFAPGVTYNYAASLDSLGSTGYPAPNTTLGTPDSFPLAEGTAWLYSQFARGTLQGYDFSNASGQRWADAGELQAAIWYLQGNQPEPYLAGGPGNVYYAEAVAALGANVDANATLSTDFGVEILNLNSGPNANNQNQLGLVPDGGATLMLIGSSLAGLAWLRRKI